MNTPDLPSVVTLAPSNGPKPTYWLNTARITGRNNPCRCGSGKKFKHCCSTAAHERMSSQKRFKVEPPKDAEPTAEKDWQHHQFSDLPASYEPTQIGL